MRAWWSRLGDYEKLDVVMGTFFSIVFSAILAVLVWVLVP